MIKQVVLNVDKSGFVLKNRKQIKKNTSMLGQQRRIIEILKLREIGFALNTKYVTKNDDFGHQKVLLGSDNKIDVCFI